MLSQANRNKRQYSGSSKDQRTHSQRDRDRILHSSALRRLGGVTQVVDPNEGLVFHNRLTHTLKVAQIGRRLAEKLLKDMKKLRLATKDYGGLNPEVVEAAALAHDLGHPPFGHTGEKELDRLVRNEGNLDDGYEGNAQTFRVVTRLELWRKDIPGLDLTRATLNAILKYPWLRQGKEGQLKNRKWGAYRADEETFRWAREPFSGSNRKTLEAEIMDWADDIAFSVHDLEDFYRAGLVPLEILATNDDRRKECLKEIFRRWDKVERIKSEETPREKFEAVFLELFLTIPIEKRFDGTLNQISALRVFTSSLISRYIQETTISKDPNEGKSYLKIPEDYLLEIKALKELTWLYVIDSQSLATQQYGKGKIIETLFMIYFEALHSNSRGLNILPPLYRETWEELIARSNGKNKFKSECARIAADIISDMTDQEALLMYKRLTGINPGSLIEVR